MRTTLVINPKGGSGKTTIAVNLASALAAEGTPTTLMDYDPQRSSLAWLASRPPHAPRIHGANGAPAKYRQLRSFEMYVPAPTRHLVIDSPAGASGALVHEMVERSDCILVPVVPSVIDIRATDSFISVLLAIPRVRAGRAHVGIVANKVRASMPAYQPFLRFVESSLELKLVARLLDSDMYLRAAESGAGIFEMDPSQTAAERRQLMPIVDWVQGENARVPGDERHGVRQIRRVSL